MEVNLNAVLKDLPMVNPNRNYWLVRTFSGEFYEVFRDYGYVAIGWNEITVHDLNQLRQNPKNKELKDSIKNKVRIATEISEKAVKIAKSKAVSQLLRFAYEIKRGDIIVIPSVNSDYLAFGEVMQTPIEVKNSPECAFVKRKKVNWIKNDVSRWSLNPNLYKFIYAHQTINSINDYALHINNTLFDFYTIDGKASLVLRVRSGSEIDPFRMGDLYSDLLFFIKEFTHDSGKTIKEGTFNVKLSLESPGTLVFAGIAGTALIMIALFTVLAGGEGGVEIDPVTKKFKFNFKSNSLLEKWSNFLDKKLERRERAFRLMQGLEHFEIEQNKDLKSLVEPKEGKSDYYTTD